MRIVCFSFIFILCLGSGFAQQYQNDTIELGEVTISVNKTPQRLKNAPASVMVIRSARIESEKANTLRGLSGIAPNFYMPEYGSKLTAPVYIRGVGSRINSPAVGLYVDRVPYFEKSVFAFDFANVEQIEILRGPQGTIYGRNTTGGIINIITRAPGNMPELKLSADFGNFNYQKYSVFYNQPITKSLSFILSGGYSNRDGFTSNSYFNESVGTDVTKTGMVKVRYNVLNKLVLTYKAGIERSKETGYPYAVLDSTGSLNDVNYNHKSRYSRDIVDNSLTLSWYLPAFTVTSISGMQYLKDKQDVDQDFMPEDYYSVYQDMKQHQYTQEIILSNNNNELLEMTLGTFGFIQHTDRTIGLTYGTESNELGLVPGNGYTKFNDEDNSGVALFGQATLKKLAGFVDITLGARYDYENNELGHIHNVQSSGTETVKKDTIFKSAFHEFLPKTAVRFTINNHNSIYLVASKGYRGGGFNTTFVRPEDQKYDSEMSWNYEMGYKSEIIPGILSVDLAVFYIDWSNQQVSQRVPIGGNMYKNAGKTDSKGFEAEISVNPFKSIFLGGSFGYTQAKYVDFRPSLLTETNYKGNYLPFVPRYTLSGFATYRYNTKKGLFEHFQLTASAYGIGKQYYNDVNTAAQNAYGFINGSLTAEARWFGVSVWAKNIFDTQYTSYRFYIDATKNWYAQAGAPFTAGITLTVKIAGQKNISK